jgi:hypothetical protein
MQRRGSAVMLSPLRSWMGAGSSIQRESLKPPGGAEQKRGAAPAMTFGGRSPYTLRVAARARPGW